MIGSIDHCFDNQTGKITFISAHAMHSNDTKTTILPINAGHQKVQIYMVVNITFLAVFGHVKEEDFRLIPNFRRK